MPVLFICVSMSITWTWCLYDM